MKKIIVLMIIVFLFSISACSENVVSSDPAESTVTSSENVSAEENTSTDSSQIEVVSDEKIPISTPSELQGTPDDFEYSNYEESEDLYMNLYPRVPEGSLAGYPFEDGIVIIFLTSEATGKYTDLSAKTLSDKLGIEIDEVEVLYPGKDYDDPLKRERAHLELRVPQRGWKALNELVEILEEKESVYEAYIRVYTMSLHDPNLKN